MTNIYSTQTATYLQYANAKNNTDAKTDSIF